MAVLKPQTPLKQGDDQLYPLTYISQVIDDSTGSRLTSTLSSLDNKYVKITGDVMTGDLSIQGATLHWDDTNQCLNFVFGG